MTAAETSEVAGTATVSLVGLTEVGTSDCPPMSTVVPVTKFVPTISSGNEAVLSITACSESDTTVGTGLLIVNCSVFEVRLPAPVIVTSTTPALAVV